MKNKRYGLLLFVLSTPLLSMFFGGFFSKTLSFFWGFLGWLIVINLWVEKKEYEALFGNKKEKNPFK